MPHLNRQQQRILKITGAVLAVAAVAGLFVYSRVHPEWLRTTVQTSSPVAGGVCYTTNLANAGNPFVVPGTLCSIVASAAHCYQLDSFGNPSGPGHFVANATCNSGLTVVFGNGEGVGATAAHLACLTDIATNVVPPEVIVGSVQVLDTETVSDTLSREHCSALVGTASPSPAASPGSSPTAVNSTTPSPSPSPGGGLPSTSPVSPSPETEGSSTTWFGNWWPY